MATLPASSEFTGSTITEAQFKTAIAAQRTFMAGLLGTAGSQAEALATMGALGAVTATKTVAYTVLAADRGKTFLCSDTWTLSLTAAATLADGFSFTVINTGTGTITIDPNASELIDGATTRVLSAGGSCIVTCNGTAFFANAGGGGFPTGTLMLFAQTAAPTGWTKSTTHNDKALRVVSGTAGSGGAIAFSTVFGRTATDGHTLTTAQMPSHTHLMGYSGVGAAIGRAIPAGPTYDLQVAEDTASTGGSTSHAHNSDIRVHYVDVIIASKD
jgi:hypothetical protein